MPLILKIEFCNELNEKYQLNITKEKIEEIFEKSIKPNNEMIELLEHLHKKYRLIMLSNNHPPTIDIIKFKHKHLTKFFDKIYFSAELKMKKPNKEFFLHMIKDAKLNPSECIFVDDKEQNVKAGIELGIKGIVFKNVEQFKKELHDIENNNK